jgi:hypothetical protein
MEQPWLEKACGPLDGVLDAGRNRMKPAEISAEIAAPDAI